MFRKLLLLCPIALILEIILLVWITAQTSFAVTAAIVFGTALLGIALIRWQGTAISRRGAGETAPRRNLFGRALIVVAGVLLITPGVLADMTGIILLLPPVRGFVQRRIAAGLESRMTFHWFGQDRSADGADATDDDVIDAESVRPAPSARLDRQD